MEQLICPLSKFFSEDGNTAKDGSGDLLLYTSKDRLGEGASLLCGPLLAWPFACQKSNERRDSAKAAALGLDGKSAPSAHPEA